MLEAMRWLERSPLGAAMRESVWLFPAVETLHIFGFAVLVGAIVAFDLRLLGLSPGASVERLERHLVPFAAASLLIVLPTGLALFASRASEYFENPVFRLKMVLLALAGLNALAFHRGVYRSVAAWDTASRIPPRARLAGFLSILLWLGIVTAGRWIAYS